MEKTDTWAAFGSKYIKAIDVLSDTDEYAIVGVDSEEETRNGKTEEVLHLTIERNGAQKLFGCNKTNGYTIQEECPISPKNAVGRVITFNKVKVTKPGTEPPEIVDGLRIVFKPQDEPSKVDTEEAGVQDDTTI